MKFGSASIVLFFLIFISFPILSVFANQLTTTMTWHVPNNTVHSIAFGGSCSSTAFIFDENRAAIDGDIDGNGSQVLPWPHRTSQSGGAACQSSSVAGMIVTNAGNVAINLDGNFASALDTNIWLKVWQGTGAGCGTNGMGGWEHRCTALTGVDLNAVTCKDFNSSNGTVSQRLITTLPVADTNQLCYSGEFMAAVIGQAAAVTVGDHNGTFQTYAS